MIPLMNISRQAALLKDELTGRVDSVILSGKYIMGEEVKQFEESFARYCGVKYAVGVGNGTEALVISLRALGIGAGDEVITCAMSFFATAEAIAAVGAKPVFVDCTMDDYTIDASQIQGAINKNTRAIIPVNLYGQCSKLDEIDRIAKEHDLFVVEDCAQAAGAYYNGKRAGSVGDLACVSFFPTKNLGCAGDGGIILTDNEDLYKKCRAYRVHGSGAEGRHTLLSLSSGEAASDGVENPTKYNNYVIGYNSRLDEVQAAVLNVKLPYLDSWNEKRNQIAKRYNEGITNAKISKPFVREGNYHIFYVYVILTENRDELRDYLNEKGINTGVYFPIPLHLQKAFDALGYREGDMPNAEYVSKHSLAIPMFPELTDEETEFIIQSINNY